MRVLKMVLVSACLVLVWANTSLADAVHVDNKTDEDIRVAVSLMNKHAKEFSVQGKSSYDYSFGKNLLTLLKVVGPDERTHTFDAGELGGIRKAKGWAQVKWVVSYYPGGEGPFLTGEEILAVKP